MGQKNRLLTKSRFKVGAECPTKLFYLDNPEYGNKKVDDPFLRSLADGGFQVGELAKLYHPNGVEVTERDYDQSHKSTITHLSHDQATIFEAAIRYDDLFVRVDVLIKNGAKLEVIEVKAKSFDCTEESPFFTKKKTLRSEWQPYLLDIAFQAYVTRKAFPNSTVSSYLMLADKYATATVDGLNQRFLIRRSENRQTSILVRSGTIQADLGAPILCRVNVDEVVHYIHNEMYGSYAAWEAYVRSLADLIKNNARHPANLSADCKHCEFRIEPTKFAKETKIGFLECWQSAGVDASSYSKPMVFDIWNFRRTQSVLDSKRYFMDQVVEMDVNPQPGDNPGLSSSQRQWLQVEKVRRNDQSSYCDVKGLSTEMRSWKFPLHFIDFETTMTALPFSKGRRPYEQIAFQFSHHTVDAKGRIEHKTQYIFRERGAFPNFAFVRALKSALGNDDGTIFRYSNHENTVLCQIIDQLSAASASTPDADELISWIKTITNGSGGRGAWTGKRSMVDLCELVKRYYYDPNMNGSNSIKKVLPAILKDSNFLATKYCNPVYGTNEGIKSLNFQKWTWLKRDTSGQIADPYKLLPPIFSDEEMEIIEPIVNASEIADGGTAMMAFAMMQFTEMTDAEAKKIQDSLLKYCELDTFAMVMIFEHWKHLVDSQTKRPHAA